MSAINERVSPKRLAEIIARAEVCDDSVLTDYRDIESIARELQQYRAAAACPAVWVRYGDANHAPDCTLDNDEAREWAARGLDVVRMVSPINAAPQGTSVPDDAFERALSVLNDTLDDCGDSERGLLLALDRMGIEVAGAAPAEQAEQLSGNTEQVSQPVLPATQFKPVADLYGIAVPGGRSTSYSTDAAEASDCRVMGWDVQEFVKLERLQEAITGNSPAIPDGYALVPIRLTAENGAKELLSGEFSETKFISCPECFGDDECETCDGSGRIEITVPVSWTTIKEIWAKGVEHFAAAPKQEVLYTCPACHEQSYEDMGYGALRCCDCGERFTKTSGAAPDKAGNSE